MEVGSAVSKGRIKSRQPISLIRSGCAHSADPGRPVKLDRAIPIAGLRHHVRYFEQREAHLAWDAVVYPFAARPELFIEFYLNQRYLVRICETVAQELAFQRDCASSLLEALRVHFGKSLLISLCDYRTFNRLRCGTLPRFDCRF